MRLTFGIVLATVIAATAVCAAIARRSGKRIGSAAFGLLAALILPMAGNLVIILSANRLLSNIGCYLYYLGLDMSIAALLHFTYVYCKIVQPKKWLRNLALTLLGFYVLALLLLGVSALYQ